MTVCLVTGPSGFVGGHLVEALVARGHEVRCLVRRTSNLSFLGNLPIKLVYGDVGDPATLPTAVEGVDYVYHVAGLVKALRERDYFLVNAGGTANLLAACAASGRDLRRFVLVSSQAAVGPPNGQPQGEDEPLRPISPYGQSKVLAERFVMAYADRLPITVVRPPSVYGPRDRETLAVYQWVARGIRTVPRREQRVSIIHVADLASGLILAAEHPAGVGRTYHLANEEPASLDGIAALIAEALGRRGLTLRLPVAAFGVGGEISELFGRISRKPQIFDRNKALELSQPSWVYDASRARRELGFRTTVDLRTGIRETAEWYKKAGWL